MEIEAQYNRLLSGTSRPEAAGNVHFFVYSVSMAEGRGDVFVALGLARALDQLGWGVSFADRHNWGNPLPQHTTHAVSMLPTASPASLPDEVVRIAWARNAIDEWAGQPHLDEFDLVLASSEAAVSTLRQSFSGPCERLSIGVDSLLFLDQNAHRDLGVVTTVNYWGQDRGLISALESMHPAVEVHWFGNNLDEVSTVSDKIVAEGPTSYYGVAGIYKRSKVVLDDLTISSRKHGCQNSRLFEALSAGALVLTNQRLGLEELGLNAVPVFNSQQELEELIEYYAAHEDDRLQLVAELQELVLKNHTFDHRAETTLQVLSKYEGSLRARVLGRFVERLHAENNELATRVESLQNSLDCARAETASYRDRKIVKLTDQLFGWVFQRRRS